MNSFDPVYLVDVNILIALLFINHDHNALVTAWFSRPGLRFSLCAFTEGGFLRNATASRPGRVTMPEATFLLQKLTRHPGYRYLPIDADWQTLTSPFSSRLHGTKQVTDAYLLGLAIRNNSTLVTMDKAILHLAGADYAPHVLLLQP